ncbi:hemophore-related protein [Mycobacterium sp. MBM]|nr:hemophore-related protein [Mycobacterium sp. MBM]
MAVFRSAARLFAGFTALAATTFGLAPVAAAEPSGKLIETTCSYAQVDAALQAEAPQLADRLHSRPEAQAKVQELLALPVPERRERVQGFLDRNPDVQAAVQKRKNTPQGQETVAKLNRVAETCHNY